MSAYDLTERELEVLAWMVEGLSNPEIADCLVVSRSAAKFHVSDALSKRTWPATRYYKVLRPTSSEYWQRSQTSRWVYSKEEGFCRR